MQIIEHGDEREREDVAALVELFASRGVKRYEELGVVESRRSMDGVTRLQREAPVVASVRDLLVPGGAGQLPARVYHPAPGDTLPLVVYVHGGGWMLSGIRQTDAMMRSLAVTANCVIVSFEYRLAPENVFPAAFDDTIAAVEWIAANATDLGGNGQVVLLGDSAGGNLVAAASLWFRDHDGPAITSQLLVYPVLAPAEGSPFASYAENADAAIIGRDTMLWFWRNYAPGHPVDDPRLAPLAALDFASLPSTMVVVSELDTLRDEGIEYARRLDAAGVPVECHLFRGGIHGIWSMDGALAQGTEVTELLASRIRSLR